MPYKDSEKIKERRRKYYLANSEKIKECARKWQLANSEKNKETHRKWQLANPEKGKKCRRKYYLANSEKIKERRRKYYLANSEKHLTKIKNNQQKIRTAVVLELNRIRTEENPTAKDLEIALKVIGVRPKSLKQLNELRR